MAMAIEEREHTKKTPTIRLLAKPICWATGKNDINFGICTSAASILASETFIRTKFCILLDNSVVLLRIIVYTPRWNDLMPSKTNNVGIVDNVCRERQRARDNGF